MKIIPEAKSETTIHAIMCSIPDADLDRIEQSARRVYLNHGERKAARHAYTRYGKTIHNTGATMFAVSAHLAADRMTDELLQQFRSEE